MFVGEFGDMQKKLAELALEIAKDNYAISLDFSHESIEQVENILADIHKEHKETGHEDGLNGVALEFGSYIAATIQKNTNIGRMERNHPDIGEDSFPFYWKGDEVMFPYGWCVKRIFDGPEDNVASKYRALVLDNDNA